MDRSAGHAAAVLVAAGSSTRMGAGGERKPFLPLGGATVLELSCAAFAAVGSVAEMVVVGHPDDVERLRELARRSPAMERVRAVVAGGATRSDSVRAGVAAVSDGAAVIAVHDAARPLVRPAVIERAIATARVEGAAVVAVPVRDTIKRSTSGLCAEETLDRATLWAAQTPQAFRAPLLRELLARAASEGFSPTDDAALHERYKGPVPIVEGEETNLKLTTPTDLWIARALLEHRAEERR